MFDAPYAFCSLGKSETNDRNPYKRMFYKFYARHRTYLVTLEFYSFQMVAIKYCDVKDKNNPKAYHKLFNDGDASRVIATCFQIMLHFWRRNNAVSFVFYASLRSVTQEVLSKKSITPNALPSFIESFKRSRYFVYRYGLLNLFSPEYFTQFADKESCVYVLMNKNQPDPQSLLIDLKNFLKKNHDVIFDPL